jgi:hypothetical protein
VHFAVTVLVATVCLGYLDGRTFNVNARRPQYREVDGSVARTTSHVPLQSDITTAVSLAASVARVASGWWAAGYIWRCIFVAMERGGISAKGVSQAISSLLPVLCHSTRKSNMAIIYITLFATFSIDYFSAALTGSFIWETADTRVPGKIPLSGIADGTTHKLEIRDNPQIISSSDAFSDMSQMLTMASASASIAWGTQSNSILNITEPSTTFRRVVNGAQYISINSTLANVMMPYFAVDAFEWVRDPHQILTDEQLSLLKQNASGWNPFLIIANGTGGLLPEGGWGVAPPASEWDFSIPISETRLFVFRIWFPNPPPLHTHQNRATLEIRDLTSSPVMTITPNICPQNYTIDPGSQINFISGFEYTMADSDNAVGGDCFAIANVSYRARVMSSQNCKIISPNVVETQALSSITGDYESEERGIVLCIAPFFVLFEEVSIN